MAKVLHEQSKAAAKRTSQQTPYGHAPGTAQLPPPPDVAPPIGDEAMPPGTSERTVVENDLIRALLEYATEVVTVAMAGEEGAEPTTLDVPFAELVIHRIEEEGIEIKESLNQLLVKRFSDELDHERILTVDQLANDQDVGIQQKVAGALVQQHVLSPNWSQRHKIYPVVEREKLVALLEDSLRRMHLADLRESSEEVQAKLEEGHWTVDEERELLAQKVQLDRDIQATSSHFGTVILPKKP